MRPAVLSALLATAVWSAAGIEVGTQTGGLRGAPVISRVYDAILDARFAQVPELLRQTCSSDGRSTATANPAVCQLLDTVALWWQIQIDPLDLSRDAAFEQKANAVVAAMEAWTRREPQRAEAWFYLGGAYGARAQWRVLRGQVLSAARDGKRIKESLERSLALDPTLKDAYFGIGLYHYYADVAPAAAKVLRFLLFLPGGDKVQGMREMQQAREGGQLLRSEADYQLHLLYLWYERQPLRARALVAELRDRHPSNPHFHQLIAEINDTYLHDDTAALRAWQAMLAAVADGRLALASMAEARARLGIAVQLDRLYESDLALEQLRPLIRTAPAAPAGVLAQALLLQAQVLDRMGQRTQALDAYKQAMAVTINPESLKIAERARAAMRSAPHADTARAYRLSVEGWRALEKGGTADAERLLTDSLALRPNEPVAMYRLARVFMAQNNPTAARPLLEQVAATRTAVPPTFLGYACIDLALLLEQAGARARAIEFYRRASAMFGADGRTKESAQRALARLSSPRAE